MQMGVAEIRPGRSETFWHTDDAWAIAIGLCLIVSGLILFAEGSSLPAWLAIVPPKWTDPAQLEHHFLVAWPRYGAQFIIWLMLITTALSALGHRPSSILPGMAALYVATVGLLAVGQWADAVTYNLEPPLLALALGLVVANSRLLPRAADAAFRVDFFIKLGVVLLGATLPLSLLIWAGPVALLQASIVSVATFTVIYGVGRALGIEQRFAAVLGVGGAVCGVSAAIAVAAAVGARKQDAGVVISIVVVWAIVMVFALPFAASALHLPAGVGGAWIGTSEFADWYNFHRRLAFRLLDARESRGELPLRLREA